MCYWILQRLKRISKRVYLAIYGCYRQRFLSLLATRVLASITSSKRRGQDSVSVHAQLSRIYLASTLDVTHVIKCTRLSPSLVARFTTHPRNLTVTHRLSSRYNTTQLQYLTSGEARLKLLLGTGLPDYTCSLTTKHE